MSNFKSDLNAESELAGFLDDNFYTYLKGSTDMGAVYNSNNTKIENPLITGFTRNFDDLDKQYKGVDIILDEAGKEFVIDEKAQLNYINNPLSTFAFELSFIKDGGKREGWFIKDGLDTKYYYLFWIHKALVDSPKNIKRNHFIDVEGLLIEKNKIIKYLESKGYTKQLLSKEAERIRRDGQFGRVNCERIYDFYFYYTKGLTEKPINLVIKKSVLERLARNHYMISKDLTTNIVKIYKKK